MIPAKYTCPTNWTEEYDGYLVAELHTHGHRVFECMDASPIPVPGGTGDQNGGLFYFMKARCVGLQCPPYEERRILTCSVCTK